MKKGAGKGFTLVEILMVVVILGIIAIIAIPRLISLREDAQKAAEDATIGVVQSGISITNAVEEARK